MTVSNIQLELIDKAKKYLQKKAYENINVHNISALLFCPQQINKTFATWRRR